MSYVPFYEDNFINYIFMKELTVGVRLAEECKRSGIENENDSIIKEIKILTSDSISNILLLALESWNIEEPKVFHSNDDWRLEEYSLSIETIGGKEQDYQYLNKTNLKNLVIGKQNIILLQYSPKARAFKIIEALKDALNLLNKKRESSKVVLEEPIKNTLMAINETLPLHVLSHFRNLVAYIEDPNFAEAFLDSNGFTLVEDFIYLPLFQIPFKKEERRRDTSLSLISDLSPSPSPIENKCCKRPKFPRPSITKKPSIVVHENIPVDNASNIIMCLSYMLEVMGTLVSAYPNILSSDIPKLGYQLSQYLKIDENYYWNVSPTISKSCTFLLTCLAHKIQKEYNEKTLKAGNERAWFQIRPLLALHKRSLKYRMESIKCFISIYSLSSQKIKKEMMKYFNRYNITKRNTTSLEDECSNLSKYIHDTMISEMTQIDENLRNLQNIILHERYVEHYFEQSVDHSIVSQQIDDLKNLYESKVFDRKYFDFTKMDANSLANKNNLDTRADITISKDYSSTNKNKMRFTKLQCELNNALVQRSKACPPQLKCAKETNNMDDNTEFSEINFKSSLQGQEQRSLKTMSNRSNTSKPKSQSLQESNSSSINDAGEKYARVRGSFHQFNSYNSGYKTNVQRYSLKERPYDPEDYKILGIKNVYDPKKDFENETHGRLALYLMLYFTKKSPERYVQIILENSCNVNRYACPFVASSLAIVKLLCDMFSLEPEHSDKPVITRTSIYMKMTFETNEILEELFCICIDHFVKLFKSMRGCAKDIPKIILILKEHLIAVLMKYPLKINNFQRNLAARIFSEVEVRNMEESGSNTDLRKSNTKRSVFYFEDGNSISPFKIKEPPAITEVRSKIKETVIQLIVKQRLACMIKGEFFGKPGGFESKVKERSIFCRLSSDTKYLYYSDMIQSKDSAKEECLEIGEKIAVENILKFQTSDEMINELSKVISGAEFSSLQEIFKIHPFQFSISFEIQNKVPKDQLKLELIARDKSTYDYFCDGLNILLSKTMESEKYWDDFKKLEQMEASMAYIQVNKRDTSKNLPKVPLPPSNYNFSQHHHSNRKVSSCQN